MANDSAPDPRDVEIWKQNREYLISQKGKSDDDFEKNHVYIAAGTLVLSMTFLEKIAPIDKATGVACIIISWSLLAISLVVNFLSHLFASHYTDKQIELNDETNDPDRVNKLMIENNKSLKKMNWISVGSLLLGILFLVIYCSLNVYHMNHMNQEVERKVIIRPHENDENKGRTNVPLQRPVQNPQPVNPQPAPQPATEKPKP